MKIPTHKESLKLLKKYGIEGKVLDHCLIVNKIALFLGKKLKEKGKELNLKLLDAASLLHDIGKLRSDKTGKDHLEEGVNILNEEGFPEVAVLIGKHRLDKILNNSLITWEEKIIYYSDRRGGLNLMLCNERFKDMLKRYPNMKEIIKKVKPKLKKLEKEIFDILKIDKNLESLK